MPGGKEPGSKAWRQEGAYGSFSFRSLYLEQSMVESEARKWAVLTDEGPI